MELVTDKFEIYKFYKGLLEMRHYFWRRAVESDDGSGCGRVPFGVGKGLVESTSRGPPVFWGKKTTSLIEVLLKSTCKREHR